MRNLHKVSLFVVALACCDAFVQTRRAAPMPSWSVLHSAARTPTTHRMIPVLGKVQPLLSSSPLLSGALVSGQSIAAAGASTVHYALAAPEIRLGFGIRVVAPPVIKVVDRTARRIRKAFSQQTDQCFLNSDADFYAAALSDLLLVNGAMRGVAESFPSSAVSGAIPAATKLSYVLYAGAVASAMKNQVLGRQPYPLQRAGAAAVWAATALAAADIISSSAKMPMNKVVGLGGLTGAIVSLFVKDISSNIFGGLTVVLNDRFRPGDTVSFKAGGTEYSGQVESIGLMETAVRSSKDQKVSCVPNALLAQAPITKIQAGNNKSVRH